MTLIQFIDSKGTRAVGVIGDSTARRVEGVDSVYTLAREAGERGLTLTEVVAEKGLGERIDPAAILAAGQMLPPINHPDPAHLWVTGTGLTHLGSAATRDAMHKSDSRASEAPLTDSMKMFRMGLDGGKPTPGIEGAQPEWFYKGNGAIVARPNGPIAAPAFALDAGEEPEIAGIYLMGADGTPLRLGFALGNDFSDHLTERANYLWLAHSKLRACSFGPELRLGELPRSVSGMSRILRAGAPIWERPFLSGEDNMSHSIANLEHHHFKYELFRRPGDVHVHFFGTATLSFADGIRTEAGDVFEITAQQFGLPLSNVLVQEPSKAVTARTL